MRTSLNKLRQTEEFLSGKMEPAEQVLFRAKLLLDPVLHLDLVVQKMAYAVIKCYGRRQNRKLLDAAFDRLMSDPATANVAREIKELF